MKPICTLVFTLLLTLTAASVYSQSAVAAKPGIFDGSPKFINCPASEFSNAFSYNEGQHITLFLSGNYKFSGTVISNIEKYSNLQSMTIQSDAAEHTILHLSKQTNEDNSINYVGRILDSAAAEGYEIKKDQAGKYTFEKVETGKVLQLCNL